MKFMWLSSWGSVRRGITVLTKACHWFLSWVTLIMFLSYPLQYYPPCCSCILIVVSSFQVFHLRTFCAFIVIFYARYTQLFCPAWHDHSSNVLWKVRMIKFSLFLLHLSLKHMKCCMCNVWDILWYICVDLRIYIYIYIYMRWRLRW